MKRERTRLDQLPDADAWPSPDPDDRLIPMQTHAWMRARSAALGESADRRLIAVKTGDRIEAIAPLIQVGGWLREMPALYEPSDLVWSSPESLRELAAALAAQPLPVFLDRLPGDSPTLPMLRRAYAGRGIVRVQPAMATPVLELDPRRRDVESVLNAGRRSDIRRAERRARGLGEVGYDIVTPGSEDELETLMREVYSVESRSWKEQAGSSLSSNVWQGAFFRRFARDAMRTGVLRLAFLRIAGAAVAVQIAVEWRQRFWLLKISHDQSFSMCSPGQLLMAHTLSHAIRANLLSYEFMGVMDDWTRLWTRRVREHVQVRAIPFSAATGKMLIKRTLRSALGGLGRFAR